MATYLIKQEHGLPLLRQATLSMSSELQTDVLSVAPNLYADETIATLCEAIRSSFSSVSVVNLVDGDTIIFEIPPYITDNTIWSGVALYKRAINNALNTADQSSTETVHVIALSCFPWS